MAKSLLHPALNLRNVLQSFTFNNTPYSMIATDRQGTIQAFNTVAQRLLGYSPEEVIGRLPPVMFHDPIELLPDFIQPLIGDNDLFQPAFEVLIAKAHQGSLDEREWTYIRKNGDRFPVWLSISSIKNENDILIGFLFSGKDITEQKRSEEENLSILSNKIYPLTKQKINLFV